MKTPWGYSDDQKSYAPGVVFYSTPSHGGFKLDAEANAKVPQTIRNRDGWYEEDCEYIKVAITFPHLFDDRVVARARKQYPQFADTLFA